MYYGVVNEETVKYFSEEDAFLHVYVILRVRGVVSSILATVYLRDR